MDFKFIKIFYDVRELQFKWLNLITIQVDKTNFWNNLN